MFRISDSQKKLGIVLALILAVVIIGGGAAVFPSASNQGFSPEQPIPFSHKLHAGQYKIACIYCHVGVEKSRHATVPAVATCMNCHTLVKTDNPWIKKIREAYAAGKPIEWIRVHELPDYVYFPHKRHVAKGISCQTCHGQVQEMTRIKQYAPLTMGWCMECHRGQTTPKEVVAKFFPNQPADAAGRHPVAPTNCSTCHN